MLQGLDDEAAKTSSWLEELQLVQAESVGSPEPNLVRSRPGSEQAPAAPAATATGGHSARELLPVELHGARSAEAAQDGATAVSPAAQTAQPARHARQGDPAEGVRIPQEVTWASARAALLATCPALAAARAAWACAEQRRSDACGAVKAAAAELRALKERLPPAMEAPSSDEALAAPVSPGPGPAAEDWDLADADFQAASEAATAAVGKANERRVRLRAEVWALQACWDARCQAVRVVSKRAAAAQLRECLELAWACADVQHPSQELERAGHAALAALAVLHSPLVACRSLVMPFIHQLACRRTSSEEQCCVTRGRVQGVQGSS